MADVTIIDYGVGNLLSVRRAFEHVGAEVELVSSPEKVLMAKRLVLPGVGAFADAMSELKERGLVEAIQEYCQGNRPFLGICLGMQMMMESSEEFGFHEGLGLIPGRVIAIPQMGVSGQGHKVPHIGWNGLLATECDWKTSILNGVEETAAVYFIHSFVAHPEHTEHCLAKCDYNGLPLTAVLRSGNLYGFQFHPEKSGEVGLKMIKNFFMMK